MNSKTKDSFLSNRDKFAKTSGCENLYEYIDQFSLYAGEFTLGNKLFTYDLLRAASKVPGDIAEFGCWKGSNLMFMAKVKSLLEPHSPKRVIGFDNFSGLPEAIDIDGDYAADQAGRYCGNEKTLRAAIELFGYEDFVELVVGDATKTIPRYIEDNSDLVLSFAYIDFDLYEPCKMALDLIDKSLSVGGVIAFDEACTKRWPGETIAMKEFLAKTSSQYETINNDFSKQPTLALKRKS
jgi:hypothetical protein